MKFLILLFLVSMPVYGFSEPETLLFGGLVVGEWGDSGYPFPAIELRVGSETQFEKFLFINKVAYSPTNKIGLNVEQISFETGAWLDLPNGFLVGASGEWVRISFQDKEGKESFLEFKPYILGGYQKGNLRVLGSLRLPGFDQRYHVMRFAGEVSDKIGQFRIGMKGGVSSFHPRENPSRQFSNQFFLETFVDLTHHFFKN